MIRIQCESARESGFWRESVCGRGVFQPRDSQHFKSIQGVSGKRRARDEPKNKQGVCKFVAMEGPVEITPEVYKMGEGKWKNPLTETVLEKRDIDAKTNRGHQEKVCAGLLP